MRPGRISDGELRSAPRSCSSHGPPGLDPAGRISIIIPTLDEEECLGRTLESSWGATGVERIVVDGGSSDGTVRIARAHGCRVLVAPPGRAGQMNVGAAVASGPVLLFLHADTRLPERFEEPVRATLDRAGVVAGAFRLAIENARGPLRFIQWAANFRSRWLGMPYGDQAVFAKAAVFRAVGGFPDLPILEDLEMIRRFRRFGRIAVVDATVTTSSRRWASRGALRGSWINQMVLAGYFAGVSPDRLLRWYGRMGGRSQRAGDRGDDESRTSPGSSSRSGVGALSSAGPCGGRGGGRATSEALGSGLLPPDSAGPSMAGPVG